MPDIGLEIAISAALVVIFVGRLGCSGLQLFHSAVCSLELSLWSPCLVYGRRTYLLSFEIKCDLSIHEVIRKSLYGSKSNFHSARSYICLEKPGNPKTLKQQLRDFVFGILTDIIIH